MTSQSEVAPSNPDFSTGTKARQPQSEPFLTEICLPLFRCYSAVVESDVGGHRNAVFTLLYLDARDPGSDPWSRLQEGTS